MHKVIRIQQDFENADGPFSEQDFPEKRLLEAVEPQNDYEKAMLLTAFSTCDYNRDAMRLSENLIERLKYPESVSKVRLGRIESGSSERIILC